MHIPKLSRWVAQNSGEKYVDKERIPKDKSKGRVNGFMQGEMKHRRRAVIQGIGEQHLPKVPKDTRVIDEFNEEFEGLRNHANSIVHLNSPERINEMEAVRVELDSFVDKVKAQAGSTMRLNGWDGIDEMEVFHSFISDILVRIDNEIFRIQDDSLKKKSLEIQEKTKQLNSMQKEIDSTRESLQKNTGMNSVLLCFLLYLGWALAFLVLSSWKLGVPLDKVLLQIDTSISFPLLYCILILPPILMTIGWKRFGRKKAEKNWHRQWDKEGERIGQLSKEIQLLSEEYESECKIHQEMKYKTNRLISICAYLQKRIDEEEKIIEQAKRLEEAKKYRESHEREVLVAAKAFDESVVAARNAALNNKNVIQDLIEYIADIYVRVIEKQFSDNYEREIECGFSFTVWSDRITFQPEVFTQDGKNMDTAYRFTEHRKANLTTLEEQQGLAWALMVHVENEMRVRRFLVQAERNQIADEQKWSRKNIEARIDMTCSIRNPYFEEEKKMV